MYLDNITIFNRFYDTLLEERKNRIFYKNTLLFRVSFKQTKKKGFLMF